MVGSLPRVIAKGLINQGFASVQPPPDLQAKLDEIYNCAKVLRSIRDGGSGGVFRVKFESEEPMTPSANPRRPQRACAVHEAINHAWSKTVGGSKQYGVPSSNPEERLDSIWAGVAALLKERFEWITEEDLIENPTASELVSHIMAVETAQHDALDTMLAGGHVGGSKSSSSPRTRAQRSDQSAKKTSPDHAGGSSGGGSDAQQQRGHVHNKVHEVGGSSGEKQKGTDVRCIEARMRVCGRKACAMLDQISRDALVECMPDALSLLRRWSPTEPANRPLRFGSMLNMHCFNNGKSKSAVTQTSPQDSLRPSRLRASAAFAPRSQPSPDKNRSQHDDALSPGVLRRHPKVEGGGAGCNRKEPVEDAGGASRSLFGKRRWGNSVDAEDHASKYEAGGAGRKKAGSLSPEAGSRSARKQQQQQPMYDDLAGISRDLAVISAALKSTRGSRLPALSPPPNEGLSWADGTATEVHTRGMISAFYCKGHMQVEQRDGTNKVCVAGHIIFVAGGTLEAATTYKPSKKDEGILLWGGRQKISGCRVRISERGEGLAMAYELLAHPLSWLNANEYGRSTLGKATPPLFRDEFSVENYYKNCPEGRKAAERVVALDKFGDAKETVCRWLLEEERDSKGLDEAARAIVEAQGKQSLAVEVNELQDDCIDLLSEDRAAGGPPRKRVRVHSVGADDSMEEETLQCVTIDRFEPKQKRARPSAAAAMACILGQDVAALISRKLDVVGLCRASMVCSVWKTACYSPKCWQAVDFSKGGAASMLTDKGLLQMYGRLRHARSVNFDNCRITDCGIEAFLWGEGWLPLPFRKAEKEIWDNEAPVYGLLPAWYGRVVEVKWNKFRVYGIGHDDAGSAFVKGRTDLNEEVRVQADIVRNAMEGLDARGGHVEDAYVLGARDDGWGGYSTLERVSIAGCKLITIRGARMLERATKHVDGLPGPVTICVEAEGGIARRRLIFFKIRGNQPLKRLLKAYVLSAFLNNPDMPLDFYFNGRTVYCHDTAQALGLQDTDVVKATLPRMRVIIQGIQSLASKGNVQIMVRASEAIVAIVQIYQEHIGRDLPMELSSSDTKFEAIEQDKTPALSQWHDGHILYAWPMDKTKRAGGAGSAISSPPPAPSRPAAAFDPLAQQ